MIAKKLKNLLKIKRAKTTGILLALKTVSIKPLNVTLDAMDIMKLAGLNMWRNISQRLCSLQETDQWINDYLVALQKSLELHWAKTLQLTDLLSNGWDATGITNCQISTESYTEELLHLQDLTNDI